MRHQLRSRFIIENGALSRINRQIPVQVQRHVAEMHGFGQPSAIGKIGAAGFLAPDGQLDADVSLEGIKAKARVVVQGWKLWLKGRVRALCAFGGCIVDESKTLINRSGGKKTYPLLDV